MGEHQSLFHLTGFSVLYLLPVLVATLSGLLLTYYRIVFPTDRGKHKCLEPPGPWLVPWIGRVHDLPHSALSTLCLKFAEWSEAHGLIFKTKTFGETFIVISDRQVCEGLLVKRADIHSNRPSFTSLGGLEGDEGADGRVSAAAGRQR